MDKKLRSIGLSIPIRFPVTGFVNFNPFNSADVLAFCKVSFICFTNLRHNPSLSLSEFLSCFALVDFELNLIGFFEFATAIAAAACGVAGTGCGSSGGGVLGLFVAAPIGDLGDVFLAGAAGTGVLPILGGELLCKLVGELLFGKLIPAPGGEFEDALFGGIVGLLLRCRTSISNLFSINLLICSLYGSLSPFIIISKSPYI